MVGQGSVVYTMDTVEILGERVMDTAVDKFVSGPVDTTAPSVSSEGFIRHDEIQSVLTQNGVVQTALSGIPILTASGSVSAVSDQLLVLTTENMLSFNSGVLLPPSLSVPTVTRVVKDYTVHTEVRTAVASSGRNFI